MNPILHYQSALAAAVDADPVLRLAHVAAWLDPMRSILDDDDLDAAMYGEDPDAAITMALHVTRRNFPEVYIDTLDALSTGQSYSAIDRLVCTALNEKGIAVDNLEWLGWGIPLPAYGVDFEDPDFWSSHPDAAPVLACFGILPELNPYRIEIPDTVYRVAQIVEASLRAQSDRTWQQVAGLVSWLFGLSGNSSVSMSYEMMAEIEPLGWTPDEVEFALEIITEAEEIIADAMDALVWLRANDDALSALRQKAKRTYRSLKVPKCSNDSVSD